MKVSESISKIDWKLLHKQKMTLLRLSDSKHLLPGEEDAIMDVILLLDALEDEHGPEHFDLDEGET